MSARRDGDAALDGCTVVEVALDEAGQYAGRLLSQLGARVLKIEALDGDRTRTQPPYVRDGRGRRSITHEYLNAGKESVAVDLDDAFAFDLVARFASRTEVGRCAVLVTPACAHRVPDALRVPIFVVGPYGATGEKASAPSTPFTRYHAGGSGYLVPSERPTAPGTLAGDASAGTSIAVAVTSIFAMDSQNAVGSDQPSVRVDYSEQAHAVNLEKMFIGRVSKHGVDLTRDNHRYPFGGAVACSDGHVSMLINEKHQWKGLCMALGRDEWVDDVRFEGGPGRVAMRDEIVAALDAWCATRTRDEVLAAMQRQDVPIGAVRTVQEVDRSPAMRARGFLTDADTPYGLATFMGLPYGADSRFKAAGRPFAPELGEHTRAVLREVGHDDGELALFERLRLVRYGDAGDQDE